VEIELEYVASAFELLQLADAAPLENIAQDNVDRFHAQPNGNAIEIDHAHVGRHWDIYPFTHAGHAFVTPAGILVILEIERLDALANANGRGGRVYRLGVVPQFRLRECLAQRDQRFDLLLRRLDAAFVFEGVETMVPDHVAGVADDLVGSIDGALSALVR